MLELDYLTFHEQDGVRRASALAELVYEPATPGKEKVASENSWRFIAPMGPIDLEEIRWYLEKCAIWPSGFFKDRGRRVEQSLKEWGCSLYDAAFRKEHVANVREAWAKVPAEAHRRFSVLREIESGSTCVVGTARGGR